MKYRADIDGLRALAVVPVVLFHAGLPYVEGGYVGVDVFFVISGYVITWRIQEDLAAGRFSIVDFYERRIRRILPALLFTILMSFGLAFVFFLPPAMAEFSRSVAATVVFLSNVYFWVSSGYFDAAAQTRPLLHTWSLAVEEQFYLVIPVAMYLAYRYGRRHMALLFAVGAALSLGLSIAVTDKAPSANFFLLVTRAWELMVGALLVLLPLRPLASRAAREMLAAAGLAMIAYAVFTYTEGTPFPGAAALLPTLGAALLIYVGRDHRTVASALLAARPMVAIGLISYSLYLVHWPVAVFTRYHLLREPDPLHIVFIVVASLVLAVFSWRFIESPFRRPAAPVRRSTLFAGTVAALAATGLLGAIGVITGGFHMRFPDYAQKQLATPAQQEWKAGVCFLVDQEPGDWKPEECMRTTGAPTNALLWGDSFAAHYVPGLIANSEGLSANIIQYTFAGCPPVLSYRSFAIPGCHAFNQRVFDIVKEFDVKTVILGTRWDLLPRREGLQETVEQLEALGVEVHVIGQSPIFAFDVKDLAYRGAGVTPNGSAAWTISFDPEENRRLARLAGKAGFIDPLSHFCRGELCTYMKQHELLYWDYGHFTDFGSAVAVRAYFPLYRKDSQSSAQLHVPGLPQ